MSARRLSLSTIFTSIITLAASAPIDIRDAKHSVVPNECVTSQATGQAVIENTTAFTVYIQSVAGNEADPIVAVGPGDAYIEDYRNGPHGSGVAIKISNDASDWSSPMLLEYTPNQSLGMIFYDMSVSVGGKGYGNGGIGNTYSLVPSTLGGFASCVSINHSNSYTHLGEHDNATKACPLATSLTLHLSQDSSKD